MKFVCISVANIEVARSSSASVHACQLAAAILQFESPGAQIDVLPLIDYEMKSCRMCGSCLPDLCCPRDAAFNRVFTKMRLADGLLVVVPHYAPLPSKLMILLEKMEEMAYLGWCADEQNFRFPLAGRPVAVIGHGGQSAPEALDYYQKALVEPVANAFASCGMKVVSAGEDAPYGVSFGIQSLTKNPDSIFVDIRHDWESVRGRIAPLVKNLAASVPSH
jgi:multimeric flavodoxin WrbA